MAIQQYYGAGGAAVAAGAAVGRRKCLRRLPHVFSRVIELPLSARADVAILNFTDSYCFVASSAGLTNSRVQPHLIRIHPGVIKLVVGEPGRVRDDMELDRWRFRLAESSRPELASVICENGRLVVMVPKGVSGENGEEGEGIGPRGQRGR